MRVASHRFVEPDGGRRGSARGTRPARAATGAGGRGRQRAAARHRWNGVAATAGTGVRAQAASAALRARIIRPPRTGDDRRRPAVERRRIPGALDDELSGPRCPTIRCQAQGLDRLAASHLGVSDAERQAIARDGFVISARQSFPTFFYGYKAIYADHLPLYVSVDSVIHAVHRSYDAR